ncbi:MAG: SIMPL domain-containing protein [Crocinitomicaceae bacterium]|nr:SIMPL domain-containing protein [Crocinitomicaceae bacterium]
MNNKNAIIYSAAIILAVALSCWTYLNRYPDNNDGRIEVKGMAQKDFESDLIVWEGSYKREKVNLKEAYAAITNDKQIVEDFLVSNGVSKENIVFGPVSTDEVFETLYSNDGDIIGREFKTFNLTQEVMIESKNVANIEKVSRMITEVLNSGVRFYSYNPRYYYSELPSLKLDLISRATEDAKLRAENIVEKSGASLGDLNFADMGVLQIVGQNSDESYSWGGAFNTSSKKKTASITIDLSYDVKN